MVPPGIQNANVGCRSIKYPSPDSTQSMTFAANAHFMEKSVRQPHIPNLDAVPKPYRYFAINKPYKMVSQFVSSHRVTLLGDLDFTFPEYTHAIGRLDNNSEGLLLLTTDRRITKLLFESDTAHQRTYLVQVKHEVQPDTLERLRTGVTIRVKGGGDYVTLPCGVDIITDPLLYFNDTHPLQLRPPYTWLLLKLTEGKFHQVRKMVDAVGHQCRRLVRVAIEDLSIGDLPRGGVKEMEEAEFYRLLKI